MAVRAAALALLLRGLALLAAVAPASPSTADTAQTTLTGLAKDGVFTVALASPERLAAIAVGSSAPTRRAQVEALLASGLNVFGDPSLSTLIVADLRPPPASETEDLTVAASHLLAGLPAQALAEPTEANLGTFGIPPQLQPVVARLVEPSPLSKVSPSQLRGSLWWSPTVVLCSRQGDCPVISLVGVPCGFFAKPPLWPAGAATHAIAAVDLLWRLAKVSGFSPWADTTAPLVPQGAVRGAALLESLAALKDPHLRLHATTGGVAERTLWISGQPSSLAALVWATQVGLGLQCRQTPQPQHVFELFYGPLSRSSPDYWIALPGRGYVSPAQTELGRAAVARSDYGSMVPLQASYRLHELPRIYSMWLQREMGADPGDPEVVWLQSLELGDVKLGEDGHSTTRVLWLLPLFSG